MSFLPDRPPAQDGHSGRLRRPARFQAKPLERREQAAQGVAFDAEGVRGDQPHVAEHVVAARLEHGDRLPLDHARLSSARLHLEAPDRDERGGGRDQELDPDLLAPVARGLPLRELAEGPPRDGLERLDVAERLGAAGLVRPVGQLLPADLAHHAAQHPRVEEGLHHVRVAAAQEPHLADPPLRRGDVGSRHDLVRPRIEAGQEARRQLGLGAGGRRPGEGQRHGRARAQALGRGSLHGLCARRPRSRRIRQAGVTKRSQTSALIIVAPESSEK
jgi:hypothetical protein